MVERTLRHASCGMSLPHLSKTRSAYCASPASLHDFTRLGFTLAPETRELIRQIGQSGELAALVAERVWSELSRALDEDDPASLLCYPARMRSAGICCFLKSMPFTGYRKPPNTIRKSIPASMS